MRLLLALLSLTLADVAAERRSVPTYTIDLDLPPEERFKVLVRPGTGLNATVWKFWTKYFVGDPLLKDALFALVAARGHEAQRAALCGHLHSQVQRFLRAGLAERPSVRLQRCSEDSLRLPPSRTGNVVELG